MQCLYRFFANNERFKINMCIYIYNLLYTVKTYSLYFDSCICVLEIVCFIFYSQSSLHRVHIILPFVVMLIPPGQGVGPAKPQRNHGTHMDSSDVVGEGFALLRA